MSEENQTTPPATEGSGDELNFIQDVQVNLQVLLGEAVMSIGDIMKCGKGSIIPLTQKVGDPFKIFLNKRPLAEGEVVEAGEKLAIKITNVLKQS